MKLTGKLTTLLVAFFATFSSFAQTCGLTQEITICDMASLDFDNDGNPDGIINLYDEYFNATGVNLEIGTWSIEGSLSLPLNEVTGEVSLWEYKYSSAINLGNYVYILTTPTCGSSPAVTLTIELGSFSGVALPPSGTTDINLEICEGTINLFETLVSNETIPAPHINGLWEIVEQETNINVSFFEASTGTLTASVLYQEGLPLIDKGEFKFRYTVPLTENCSAQSTEVKVSIVRQVDSGISSGLSICESEIINGDYDIDIDLTDDEYLLGEDVEGFWSSGSNDYTNEISEVFDSEVNIKRLYDALIADRGIRFGAESFRFTYDVPQRSGVCLDRVSNINIQVFEELRPFNQNANMNSFCLEDTTSVNLFSFLDFTNELGIDFIYPNGSGNTDWSVVSTPGNQLVFFDSEGIFDFFQNNDYIQPGNYVFRYSVDADINGIGSTCQNLSTDITVVVLPFDYAGELNADLIEICETEQSVILTSLLDVDVLKGNVATTGVWTDADGVIFDNNFIFPEIDADVVYELDYNTIHPVSGCTDSSQLKFTLINEKLPGSAGESITADGIVKLCADDLNVNLFDFLQNSDPIGQWTGPAGYVSEDHLGEFIFNDTTLPRLIQGEYVYTIGDGENCTSIESTAIIIEFVDPIILADTVDDFYCLEDVSIDLATLLEVSAPTDGVFTDLDNTGNLTGSVFTFVTVGQFNFRYTLDVSPCALATQDFVIQVSDGSVAPSPGIEPEAPIKVCADNLTINLFDQLLGTPSQSGTWTGPFTYQSIDHIGQFEHNNETLPILGPGIYTYRVGGGTCDAPFAEAEVTIEIEEPIVLGDDINRSFCKLSGSTNLFSLLDQNSVITGQFTDTDMTEALSADGSLDFSNLSTGTYNFKYSIPNNAPCLESSLNVSINIFETPVPTEADKDFCILDAKRLEDIKVYYFIPSEVEGEEPIRVELDSDVTNWYASLQSDQPIIDNPVLIDEAIYYVTNVSDVDGEECESERFEVQVNILNVGEQIIIDNTLTVKCPLEFQDGVSADGNGINDTFSLKWKDDAYDIEAAFPDYKLEIYNRYGVIVYKGNPSTDEFNGNSNVSLSIGSDLPSGVYFYIFNPNFKNNKPVQGSFYLSK